MSDDILSVLKQSNKMRLIEKKIMERQIMERQNTASKTQLEGVEMDDTELVKKVRVNFLAAHNLKFCTINGMEKSSFTAAWLNGV